MKSTLAREGKIDVRVDEEQSKKLKEIVNLLVHAGYHRARIKGLPPFDKIIGGMTWCIEVSNFEVDVDLLFHDSLIIGQKIALTERIVEVLLLMRCPYKLEPHQIQGLDTIHIYPVIEWLVKLAITTRAVYEDHTRRIALDEFNRYYKLGTYDSSKTGDCRSIKLLKDLEVTYGHGGIRRNKKGAGEKIYNLLELADTGEIKKFDGQNLEECKNEVGIVAELENQALMLQAEMNDREKEYKLLTEKVAERTNVLDEHEKILETIKGTVEELKGKNVEVDESQVNELAELISSNEKAKKKIQDFKEKCRSDAEELKDEISSLQKSLSEAESEDCSDLVEVKRSETERLKSFRSRMAKKAREIELMKRKIDDVPGRAELAQYQRRFVELYELVDSQHHEMMQFNSLYNSLTDENAFMEKEHSLLNSILDNMEQATLSSSNLGEFIQQLESMIEGIQQNKFKLERKLGEAKAERDALKCDLHRFQEMQIRYIQLVRKFSQEVNKNEVLFGKLSIAGESGG